MAYLHQHADAWAGPSAVGSGQKGEGTEQLGPQCQGEDLGSVKSICEGRISQAVPREPLVRQLRYKDDALGPRGPSTFALGGRGT